MIRIENEGAMRVLTLDRPSKANALTVEMLEELATLVEEASSVPEIKTIVLTGSGKVFSAGADLDAARQGLAVHSVWERLSGALASCPVLTISALNGTVAGGAMGMVLATDLRLAVPDAKFFYPVMKLGFLPQPSDPKRLTALVGTARAKLILMAGCKILAEEALTWGLVDRVTENPLTDARLLAADALAAERDHVTAIAAMFE